MWTIIYGPVKRVRLPVNPIRKCQLYHYNPSLLCLILLNIWLLTVLVLCHGLDATSKCVVRQIKMKTRGIDTQKWTLAYIWYERVWSAYNTQFSRSYDTHLPHSPNPTHRVAYTRQSQFLRINNTRVFIFIWRTIYTHFHEIGLFFCLFL